MSELLENVHQRVVGRTDEILMIIAALRSGRHLFLEGPPGTSKSTILRAVAECSGKAFCLVTGNSDLTTSKLIGYFDPAETLSKGYLPEHFYPGSLLQAMKEGMFLYVEEFNRLPDETTNVFVTVMSENKLSVPRLGIVGAHKDFRIIAALNPLDDIGISRISRALKDRFCSFKMEYQSRDEEIEIVKRCTCHETDPIVELAVDIARRTRTHPDLKLGASVRASIDMVKIYREVLEILHDAGTRETERTLEKLLLNSAFMAFRNKIWMYETSEKTSEQVVEEIFRGMLGAKKKNYRTDDRLMFESGTVGGRTPRDRAEFTPMDERIDAMIQDNRMESLVDFAQEHPIRVGDMLGSYRIVLAQWEAYDPDMLRRLLTLTWDRLDIATRRQFIHLMLRMVYRTSKSEVASKGRPTGEVTLAPFDFQGDEIALDKTVESLTESRSMSYDNIFVLDRKKRKRAAILIMDASGSMQGTKLSMAAVAVGSLAMNLDGEDEYGIVLFSERVNLLKRIDQAMHIDRVISQVLDILPEGRTNLCLGLSAGLREIQRSRVEQRIGILLTDGWQNLGHDPIALAAKFPQLHVINLPGGSPELSGKIAKAGRGRCVTATDVLQVPSAVLATLQ